MKRILGFLPLVVSAYCGLIGCQAGTEDLDSSAQGDEKISVAIVAETADILDWAFPMFKNMCEGASGSAFHCDMLDTRPIFEGHPDYFMLDGIHPLAPGAQAIADSIWSILTAQCITAPASGGCCTE